MDLNKDGKVDDKDAKIAYDKVCSSYTNSLHDIVFILQSHHRRWRCWVIRCHPEEDSLRDWSWD